MDMPKRSSLPVRAEASSAGESVAGKATMQAKEEDRGVGSSQHEELLSKVAHNARQSLAACGASA